jgi:phosphoribosylformimino-5-aminoimidazole carboxamide ribotide isomerase
MRVIPVLDLRAGRAVHASGGERHGFPPVRSVLVSESASGDACALARAFHHTLGCEECYVADLDAIEGGSPQRALLEPLARVGSRLFIDAGVATVERARELLDAGAARIVVGLETLPSFVALELVTRAIGPERVMFSLDLRGGRPVLHAGAAPRETPLALVGRAAAAGATAILVLDLARVASGRGLDRALLEAIRSAHPGLELLAGGGIASPRDLEQLAATGLDGALVATALHAGAIGKADVAALRRRGAPRRHGHESDWR